MTDRSSISTGVILDTPETETRLHELKQGINLEALIDEAQQTAIVYGGKAQEDLILPRSFGEGLIVANTGQQTAHNFAAIRLFPRHGLRQLLLPGQAEDPRVVDGKIFELQSPIDRILFNAFVNYRGFSHVLGRGERRFGMRAIDIDNAYRYHPEYEPKRTRQQFKDLIDQLQAERLLIHVGKAKARSYILSPNIEVIYVDGVVNESRLVRETPPPVVKPKKEITPPLTNGTPIPQAPIRPLPEPISPPQTPNPQVAPRVKAHPWLTTQPGEAEKRERIRVLALSKPPRKPIIDPRIQQRLDRSRQDQERQNRLKELQAQLTSELTEQEIEQVDKLMTQQGTADKLTEKSLKRSISKILETGFQDNRLPKFTKNPKRTEQRGQERKLFRVALDEARAKWGLTDATVEPIRILREFEKRIWEIDREA